MDQVECMNYPPAFQTNWQENIVDGLDFALKYTTTLHDLLLRKLRNKTVDIFEEINELSASLITNNQYENLTKFCSSTEFSG